ncbi:MAG TPA: O-acetyl-ADP-ribose deacetylase [Chthoniobacterales bacterium]
MSKIDIVRGDITRLEVDAIVNAANSSLLGGGGVDGAIHRAAGPQLLEECRTLGGCRPGEAKLTRGYNLSARFVIHTVGPVWSGGNRGEAETLANCYRNSLKLAAENEIKTIAFPAISCGAYRYPIDQAARIAVKMTQHFLKETDKIDKISFVAATHEIFDAYTHLLK